MHVVRGGKPQSSQHSQDGPRQLRKSPWSLHLSWLQATATSQQSPGEAHQSKDYYNYFYTILHLQMQELRLIEP